MLNRRTLLLSLPAGGALALAGCTMGPSGTSGVSSAIQSLCKVVPDAAALLALIGTFPQGTAALTIAQAFCAAINKGGGAPQTVQVNGKTGRGGVVVLHGVTVPYVRTGR